MNDRSPIGVRRHTCRGELVSAASQIAISQVNVSEKRATRQKESARVYLQVYIFTIFETMYFRWRDVPRSSAFLVVLAQTFHFQAAYCPVTESQSARKRS